MHFLLYIGWEQNATLKFSSSPLRHFIFTTRVKGRMERANWEDYANTMKLDGGATLNMCFKNGHKFLTCFRMQMMLLKCQGSGFLRCAKFCTAEGGISITLWN